MSTPSSKDVRRDALPYRGLGLSSNLQAADVPNPYRLLESAPGLLDFVEYSAPLRLEEARSSATLFEEMWTRRGEVPVLFHPVHLNLYGPSLEEPGALRALSDHAEAVDSAWVGNDVGWWHADGRPFPGYLYLPPPMTPAGLADARAHALHVQGALAVPLLLENPAVFRRRGPLHVLDFMAELHAATGCRLILDLGHLLSFQLAHGLPLNAGLDGFPLEAVAELHLAGGVVTRQRGRSFYADDHTQPIRQELLELLDWVRPRCPGLKALTFEGDGHPPEVAALTLRALRTWMEPPLARGEEGRAAPAAQERTAPAHEPQELAPASRPFELFLEAYGDAPGNSEDEHGLAVEQGFRRAVLVQELDRSWPLTRLALAGSPEELGAFTRSERFRRVFQPDGPSLEAAFGRFAREQALVTQDAALTTLLAFETWAKELARKAGPRARGELLLAPGVRLGTFPVDLTEALFAARALRRHLLERTWGSGALEASGLEGLRDAVHRAPKSPFQVLVALPRGRLEVRPWGDPSPGGPSSRELMREGWLVPAPGP